VSSGGVPMQQGFEVIEHPSDLGLDITAESREGLFSEAVHGLLHVIGGDLPIRSADTRRIHLHAPDVQALFVRWLSEILYLYDGEKFLAGETVVHRLTEHEIEATVRGERLNPRRHRVALDVKAVTYHQLCVEQTSDGWHARVFLDI